MKIIEKSRLLGKELKVIKGPELDKLINKVLSGLKGQEKEKFLSGLAFLKASFLKDNLTACFFLDIKCGDFFAIPDELPSEFKEGEMGLAFLKEASKAMLKVTSKLAQFLLNLPEHEIFFVDSSYYLVGDGPYERPNRLKLLSPQYSFWPVDSILTKKEIVDMIFWGAISTEIKNDPLGKDIFKIDQIKFEEVQHSCTFEKRLSLVREKEPWKEIKEKLLKLDYIDEYYRPIKSLTEIKSFIRYLTIPEKECPICGKVFKVDRKNKSTCGAPSCKMKKKRLKDWARRILRSNPNISEEELAKKFKELELELKKTNKSPKKVYDIRVIAKIILGELRDYTALEAKRK